MTSDMDDDNDTIKLEISKDNKYKQFFEKGLGALLSNPHFLLLYVPGNGAKMQVIRPTSDPYHQRRMIKRINEAEGIPSFYYALSHLWGISPDNRYHWNDISEYVNDEDGQPVNPVSMRPEKRDTLLAMLKDHPDSYWWIDVLCARTDTPLDIMGDIYACCLECIAMIDCEPDLISQLHPMGDVKYEHFDRYYSNDIKAAIQYYDQYLYQLIATLYTFIQSQWWKRVWTWQEMALPFGDVRLMAETGTHKPLSNTITIDELGRNYAVISRIMLRIHYGYFNEFVHDLGKEERKRRFTKYSSLENWKIETDIARRYNKDRIQDYNKANYYLYKLLLALGTSYRRCMNPVDYVYGVLGIFQFKIPRMDDPDAVWKLFLSEIEKVVGAIDPKDNKFRISYHAYNRDIRNARDMAEVYGFFIDSIY